jgi:hypothetical protein
MNMKSLRKSTGKLENTADESGLCEFARMGFFFSDYMVFWRKAG